MKAFIDHTLWYSITWLLAYLVFGIILYTIDRQYLSKFYRWVYSMTHEEPMAAEDNRGIVFGQRASRLFVLAFVLSTIQSVSLFFFTMVHSNPFVELVLWIVEVPAMVTGFYLGQLVFPLWQKRGKVYAALDKMEDRFHNQKTAPKAESPVVEWTGPKHNTNVPSPVTTPSPVVEEDPRDLIKKFTNK